VQQLKKISGRLEEIVATIVRHVPVACRLRRRDRRMQRHNHEKPTADEPSRGGDLALEAGARHQFRSHVRPARANLSMLGILIS
jgi:hypothetical protein